MDALKQDVRHALRQMARRPGFAAVLLGTLALGIGANTAVFSVVQGVLLRPLPYPQPERLVVLWSQFPTMDLMEFGSSWPEYTEFREEQRSFSEVGAWYDLERSLTGGEQPERIQVTAFSHSMWDVLGVEAVVGRTFGPEEDVEGQDDVVVLGHGLWLRNFGGDPDVVGRSIELDGRSTVVLGVMPEDFEFRLGTPAEAWVPFGFDPANPPGRANHFARVAGRLAPGTSLQAARTELQGILRRWGADTSIGHTWRPPGHPAFLRPMHDQLVGDVRASLLVVLGAVGVVLLIACANVANLLMVRGEGRQREMSIRASIGAGRRRIAQQLLTESFIVALLGGLLGLGLAQLGLRGLLALAPATIPRLDQVQLSGEVLAFSAGVTLLAGLLFGLAPALQALGVDLGAALRREGRGGTSGGRGSRLRQVLVVSEMSLAVVLLITAGLLMQSFWKLQQVDPGFESDGLVTFGLDTPDRDFPNDPEVVEFYRTLLSRLERIPGVDHATAVRTAPLSGSLPPNDIEVEGHTPSPDGPPLNADIQVVAPGYFEALGIEILAGRAFDHRDDLASESVAVIDRELARRFFSGEDPLGRRIRQPGNEWAVIVGVVDAIRHEALDVEPRAQLYLAHAQSPAVWYAQREMTVILGTEIDPLDAIPDARAVVAEIAPNLPVFDVTTLEATVARSTANRRFSLFLQMVFAGVALTLAVIGIYGVLSYSVAQRTREIGIRMALGAGRSSVLGLVVRQGLVLVGVAAVVGVAGAAAIGGLVRGLLYQVSPTDPVIYGVVVTLLVLVGAAACWIPARRASGVDPQTALRAE